MGIHFLLGGIREHHATCLNCKGFQGKFLLGIPRRQSMFQADTSFMKKVPKELDTFPSTYQGVTRLSTNKKIRLQNHHHHHHLVFRLQFSFSLFPSHWMCQVQQALRATERCSSDVPWQVATSHGVTWELTYPTCLGKTKMIFKKWFGRGYVNS